MANLPQVGLEAVIANLGGFEAGAKAIANAYNQIEKKTGDVVRASATLRDAEGNLVRFSVASGQAGTAMQRAGASFQQAIGKIASLAIALGVTRKLQEFATESFTAGRAQNDVRNALIQTVGSVAEYNNLIASAQESTKGMVSETKLAQAGLVFLKSGIAGSSEEVGKLSAAGTALVNTYSNLGATQEKLIRFILTGNRALVDNFNLTQQQINAKTAEVEATTNLEGAEAKLEARKRLIIESGEKLLTTVSNETVQVQQAQAAWENFEAAFGQVLIAFNSATGAIPAVTGVLNQLTEGAKAWQIILQEQIPTINQTKESIAEQAAQAAISAKTQEELAAAWEQGRTDFDAFKSGLIDGTDSVEQYNKIIKDGTQGNIILADSLKLTEEEFKKLKAVSDAQDIKELSDTTRALSGTYSTLDSETVALISSQNKLSLAASTAAAAFGDQLEPAEAAIIQAARTAAEVFGGQTNALRETQIAALQTAASLSQASQELTANAAAQAKAFGGSDAFTSRRALAGFRQGSNERLAFQEEQRLAQERLAEEQEKAFKKASKEMAKSFDEAARSIVTSIESVIQPTLDEVWTPPEGAEVRFDEAARRLATVSTEGFGSEWLGQLASQFAGQDFFQPVIAAMEAGDPEALKNAATNILMNNVTNLWDVEVIKQKVREQLQQQNLRQQIIDQVKEELSMEGTIVGPEAIQPITDGLTGIVQNAPPAGEALTTLGTDIGTSQPTLDTYGQGLSDTSTLLGTISEETIPAAITKIGELTTAIKTKLVAILNTSLLPSLRNVSDFITKNLMVSFTDTDSIVNEKLIPDLGNFSENIIPDFISGMEDLNSTIKDVSGSFNELSNKVKNFKLPAVLTPGSPTPFELALIGISQAAQSAAGSMQDFSNALNGANFDKLLGIDRNLTDPLRIAGAAFDDLEKHLDKTIGKGKTGFALTNIKKAIKENISQILTSLNPTKTIDEIAAHAVPNWEKVGIKLQNVGDVFWNSFKGNAKEAVATLQDMFIEAGRTAISIGQRLTGVIGGAVDLLNSRVERLQQIVAQGGGEFEGKVLSTVEAQNLLNQALQEQASIQDDILKTKEQEQKLNFLQQQLDLFDTIKEAGLDIGQVLGGLHLGLDASIPDLIAATNKVIEAMINQVNTDLGNISSVGAALGNALTSGVTGSLGIASPSKVMQGLADNTMSSFMNRMLSWGPALAGAAGSAIAGPTMVTAPALAAGGGGVTNVFNNDFGNNNISSGMSEAEFDARVQRSIQRLMR